MFYYEEGECITNTESAESMPEVFAKEEIDKVVYFENACLNPNAYKNPKNEKQSLGGMQSLFFFAMKFERTDQQRNFRPPSSAEATTGAAAASRN